MSQIIVLKVAGSKSYTVVDRTKGTVEEVEIEKLAELAPLSSDGAFCGIEEAFAVPDVIEISARKHYTAA